MCGLTGFLDPRGTGSAEELRSRVARMTSRLAHRGPDAEGTWVDAMSGVALGHRRLSILDRSPNGRQPMHSRSGRYVIVFNGEIYNHGALRSTLDAEAVARGWRGHSDTEVLLEAIDRWGVAAALRQATGMFACALWDRSDRALYLARDRLGEKPLYYGWMGSALLFGSELKALRAHPGWRGEIDRDVLALYLRHSYVPAPHSIYQGVAKLPPGTVARWAWADTLRSPGFAPRIDAYWSLAEVAERGARGPVYGTVDSASAALEQQLREVIGEQMLADVPVGAFLSGGIDSSAVVALMQRQSGQRVRTFTVGFHERGYDEAGYAREVARHLGTDHAELYVTPREALAVVPELPRIYDEPFADSSQIPTVLVARLAREQVSVCLSGDGGDELFGGYPRYRLAMRLLPWLRALPLPARRAAAQLTAIARQAMRQLPALAAASRGDRLARLGEILALERPQALYRTLMSYWQAPEQILLAGVEPAHLLADPQRWPQFGTFGETMMYLDAATYLPDDILVKVDRAAMAVSLETRMPLLDRRIVELAWQLPAALRLPRGASKPLLREILYRHLPRALVDRPKMGFAIPVGAWLRGPLREWADALLAPQRLEADGLFAATPIRKRWLEHRQGARDWSFALWNVLMFQAWLDAERAAEAVPGAVVHPMPARQVRGAAPALAAIG